MLTTTRRNELLDAASALRDTIDAAAEAAEDLGLLPDDIVDALFSSGLLHLALPEALGGDEADLATQVEVYEEVSAADGSTGWSLMAGATSSAFCGAYMGETAVKEMFAGDRDVHAGQFAPIGTFEAVDGGYLVTGTWSFASGSDHATWITAGGTVLRDGEMAFAPSGMPEMRVAAIARDDVELRGGWDVMGLRATMSQDYGVTSLFVPEARTFELFSTSPERGGDVFRIGLMPMTSAGHAGWALGVARRAMEEISTLAPTKQRMGNAVLADDPVFHQEFAQHTAVFRSARAYVLETFREIQAAAESGVDGDELLGLKGHVRVATTHATHAAAEVVDWAYHMSGSHGLRNGSALQRCFRDIHAGTQHIFVDDSTYRNAARVWLGQNDGFIFL